MSSKEIHLQFYLLIIKAPFNFHFGFPYFAATIIISSETSWTSLQEDFKKQSILLKFKVKKMIVVDFFCLLFTYEEEFQVSWRATSKYIGSFYFSVCMSCLLFWCCIVSLAETWEEHMCDNGCSHTKAVNLTVSSFEK